MDWWPRSVVAHYFRQIICSLIVFPAFAAPILPSFSSPFPFVPAFPKALQLNFVCETLLRSDVASYTVDSFALTFLSNLLSCSSFLSCLKNHFRSGPLIVLPKILKFTFLLCSEDVCLLGIFALLGWFFPFDKTVMNYSCFSASRFSVNSRPCGSPCAIFLSSTFPGWSDETSTFSAHSLTSSCSFPPWSWEPTIVSSWDQAADLLVSISLVR